MTRPSEAELIEALKEARKALAPFADIADEYTDQEDDSFDVMAEKVALGRRFRLSIFRRARDVYDRAARSLTRAEGGKREDADAYWHKKAARLSGGLIAINQADPSVPAEVLRGIAYDVALNCIEPDVAEFQITRRAALTAPSQPASAPDHVGDVTKKANAAVAQHGFDLASTHEGKAEPVVDAFLEANPPPETQPGKDAELMRELRDEAMRLSGRSLDRGCVDSGIASNLADRAADRLEALSAGEK